jgi:hypothetical protein
MLTAISDVIKTTGIANNTSESRNRKNIISTIDEALTSISTNPDFLEIHNSDSRRTYFKGSITNELNNSLKNHPIIKEHKLIQDFLNKYEKNQNNNYAPVTNNSKINEYKEILIDLTLAEVEKRIDNKSIPVATLIVSHNEPSAPPYSHNVYPTVGTTSSSDDNNSYKKDTKKTNSIPQETIYAFNPAVMPRPTAPPENIMYATTTSSQTDPSGQQATAENKAKSEKLHDISYHSHKTKVSITNKNVSSDDVNSNNEDEYNSEKKENTITPEMKIILSYQKNEGIKILQDAQDILYKFNLTDDTCMNCGKFLYEAYSNQQNANPDITFTNEEAVDILKDASTRFNIKELI